jgi:hypothetical protein
MYKIREKQEALFRVGCLLVAGILSLVAIVSLMDRSNPIPSEFRVLSVKDLYPQVISLAKEWRDDAYLQSVNLWVYPSDTTEPLLASFGFESENEPVWLAVRIFDDIEPLEYELEEGDYSRVIEISGKAPQKAKLNFEKVSLDSLDAFYLLYDNGGEEYIREHSPIDFPLFLILEPERNMEGDKDPIWRAIFSSGVSSWHFMLNAKTHELLPPSIHD